MTLQCYDSMIILGSVLEVPSITQAQVWGNNQQKLSIYTFLIIIISIFVCYKE